MDNYEVTLDTNDDEEKDNQISDHFDDHDHDYYKDINKDDSYYNNSEKEDNFCNIEDICNRENQWYTIIRYWSVIARHKNETFYCPATLLYL